MRERIKEFIRKERVPLIIMGFVVLFAIYWRVSRQNNRETTKGKIVEINPLTREYYYTFTADGEEYHGSYAGSISSIYKGCNYNQWCLGKEIWIEYNSKYPRNNGICFSCYD